MNLAFKLLLFSIVLNFSVGLMSTVIPAFDLSADPTVGGGLLYNSQMGDEFANQFNATLNVAPDVESQSSIIDRLLDKVGLGIITKIKSVLNNYMFGFVQVLESIFGGAMDENLRTIMFGGIKTMISIGYGIGVVWLFTGKSLVKN